MEHFAAHNGVDSVHKHLHRLHHCSPLRSMELLRRERLQQQKVRQTSVLLVTVDHWHTWIYIYDDLSEICNCDILDQQRLPVQRYQNRSVELRR